MTFRVRNANKNPLTSSTTAQQLVCPTIDCVVSSNLLLQLYEAKCADLQLPVHQDQADRFFQYCQKTIKDRKLKLNEQGLGPNCARVIGTIINQTEFSILDLAKNNIGNFGLQNLAKALQRNTTLVSLDLGSNDIMN